MFNIGGSAMDLNLLTLWFWLSSAPNKSIFNLSKCILKERLFGRLLGSRGNEFRLDAVGLRNERLPCSSVRKTETDCGSLHFKCVKARDFRNLKFHVVVDLLFKSELKLRLEVVHTNYCYAF